MKFKYEGIVEGGADRYELKIDLDTDGTPGTTNTLILRVEYIDGSDPLFNVFLQNKGATGPGYPAEPKLVSAERIQKPVAARLLYGAARVVTTTTLEPIQ
jgi:hypothetical protein